VQELEVSSLLPMKVATIRIEFCIVAFSMLMFSLLGSAQDLPAGTALEARLSVATGSHISRSGDPIEATIIAPVSVRGRIVAPQGSRLLGSIANATAIGLGVKNLTASLSYDFHTLWLPGGEQIPIKVQLVEVETAKERVDGLGVVRGIHPIASISSSLAYFTVPLLGVDPAIGIPVWGVKSLIAPSANPEIDFPKGAELILRLTGGVRLPSRTTEFPVPCKFLSRGDLADFEHLLKNSQQRAYIGNQPSDIVNVLFVGSRSQLDRAFYASGWSLAERKSPLALYRMYHALTRRIGYARAPMNALTLNGAPTTVVYQKTLDTVQKRHHVRLWQYSQKSNIWLGAGAEDIGFRFQLAHWTHSTNPNIDSERAKIVNDLAYTGCVNAAGLLPRASTDLVQDPRAKYPILTDGDVTVVQLNDCVRPKPMTGAGETSALNQRGRLAHILVAFRDDLVRSNIVFTTYNGLRLLRRHNAEATIETPLGNRPPRALDWLPSAAPMETRPEP
jgi:hypothetical protein